jgi:APA family basic amino acid/polyamine antiporter
MIRGRTERDPAARVEVGEARLRRELGVPLGVVITVNAMIGTGIFRLSPQVAELAGGVRPALFVWIAGGVVSLAGALCIGGLGAAMPRAGGIYEYLRRAWGPTTAFVYGWARLFLLGPSAAGSFSRLASVAAIEAFGLPPDARLETAVAIGILAACIASNLSGVRASSTTQAVITALKYLGTVGLAVACLALPILPHAAPPTAAPSPELAPAGGALLGVLAALVSVMWSYDGWADLSALGGEVRAPERTLPRALVAGVAAVTVLYVLVNLAYERTLGLEGILASQGTGQLVATNAIAMTLGDAGRRALAALVFLSCVGACMVGVLTGSRVFVAMAADGLFLRALGRVDARGVPARAVWLTGLFGAVYVSFRSFEQLAESFVVGAFPFYFLAVAGVFVLRRRPELAGALRVPLHPFSTVVFLVGAALLLVGALADVEGIAAWAFGVVLLGIPVGWLFRRASGRGP